MSSEVKCPYCKEQFEPDDHYQSGPYECPGCYEDIWVDVEYDVSFDASCMDGKHKFVKNEEATQKHRTTVMVCERCQAVDLPDAKKGGEA